MPNVFKSNRKLGQLDFNLKILDSSHWHDDTTRQETFKVHRLTETIFFRFRDQMIKKISYKQDKSYILRDYPLMPVYKKQIDQYLHFLTKFYKFNDFAVIAARLLPNGMIPVHKDQGDYFENSYRVHIPIKTSQKCFFLLNNNWINMELGWAYEINNVSCAHGVKNLSGEPRDHLIFDLFP